MRRSYTARVRDALRTRGRRIGVAMAALFVAGVLLAAWLGAGGGRELVHVEDPGSGAVLIRDVRVWDGRSDTLAPHAGVLLENEEIARLFPAGGEIPAEAVDRDDVRVVDGGGDVLAPAFVDFHVHLGMSSGRPPWDASLFSVYPVAYEREAYLYSGVTSVVAASPVATGDAGALRRGARIHRTGKLIAARHGHPVPMLEAIVPWPLSVYAKHRTTLQLDPASPDLDRVAKVLDRDPHHLKVIVDGAIPPGSPKLRPEAIDPIVELSHREGIPVYVHVAHPDDLGPVVRAGADVIMHTPWQARIDRATLELLADRRIPVVSTTQIWEWMLRGLSEDPRFTALERTLMAPETLESLTARWTDDLGYLADHGFPRDYARQTIPRFHRNLRHNITAMREAGVPVVAGTDYGLPGLTPGASFIRELHNLSDLGFSNAEVLRMATSVPGRLLDSGEPPLGVIREGAPAELILLPANPLEDLGAVDRVRRIFSRGRIYERAVPPGDGTG